MRKLKRSVSLLLFCCLLLSLVGCGDRAITENGMMSGAVKGAVQTESATESIPPQEEAPVEETAGEAPTPDPPVKPQEVHTHSYTDKVVSPTCTAGGYTLHTCACGDSYKDSTTAALGHDYQASTVAATASAQGYTLHKCSRCGDSYKDNYTEPTGQTGSSSGTQEDCWYMGIPYLPTGQEMVERSSHYDCDAAKQYGKDYGTSLGLTHSEALLSGPHREVTASFLGSEAFLREGTKYLKEQMAALVDAACRDISDSRSTPANYEFYCYAYYSAPDIRYCLGVYYQEKAN